MNGIYNIYTSMVTITVMKNVAVLLSDHKNIRLGQKPVKSRPVTKPIVSACLRISAARRTAQYTHKCIEYPADTMTLTFRDDRKRTCARHVRGTPLRDSVPHGLRDTTSHDRQQSSERPSCAVRSVIYKTTTCCRRPRTWRPRHSSSADESTACDVMILHHLLPRNNCCHPFYCIVTSNELRRTRDLVCQYAA